ncbi:MAG: hypothetical protein NTU60_06170 [Candidatus Aminicenantes bacterium]|nr:hypothetical protein [Candidatus Aminicenantes bacterium]
MKWKVETRAYFFTYRFEMAEVELLQVDLGSLNDPASPASPDSGSVRYRGFEIVNGELRSLPLGASLDLLTGRFSWLPGPGFLESYRLVFIEAGAGSPRSFPIEIVVKARR